MTVAATTEAAEVLRHERISTGNPQLDHILGGGFPKNSINIVMGHPGTGKTIFAEQMVFHNADGDRPILYLTTLSEPLAKVVTYLQGFTFYDDERLLSGVVYEDIGGELADGGPAVVLARLRAAVREIGPKLIVIDSFKAIHDLTESRADMRRLIAELAGILSAYDTTAFLVGEYAGDQVPLFAEFAVADGIVEFARHSTAKRDDRFVRVLKLRGSGYAEGFHAFTISESGLHVFPRLVTPVVPVDPAAPRERVATGVTGLDALLDGGLWRGSAGLVTGPSGSGKTTLGLQFVAQGAEAGEPGLYLNFQENPRQLARTVQALGLDPAQLRDRGLTFRYASPVELSIDRIVVDIMEPIRAGAVRRVVIDALGDLALAAADPQRFHDYLYSLCQQFIAHGVTALLLLEVLPHGRGGVARDHARFSSMADALIELDIELRGEPHRTIRVAKARGIAHDLRVHEMTLETDGIHIGSSIAQT